MRESGGWRYGFEDTGLYARIREAGFQISCIYEFYEMEKEEEKEKSRKHIEAAAETGWGKEKGVEVTIEDFDDYTSPLSRNRGIRWFLDNVPDLGFTFDMGNFAFMQEDIWQAWELLADRIRHIHCKDRCRGLEPAPAGKGDIPMRELLEKLKETGYEGWLAAEHFGAPDQEAFLLESAGFLVKNLNSADR